MIKIDKKYYPYFLISIPLLIYLVSAVLLFNPQLFQGGDNVIYMILSKSIMKYHRYADLHLEGAPAHTKYPFGYPLLLGLWSTVSHSNVWFKILSLISGLLGVLFLSLMTKKNYVLLLSVIVVISFNTTFMVYTSRILSEIPFFMFFALFMYLFSIWYSKEEKDWQFYVLVFASVIPFYIRSVGIVIPAAMALYYIKEKKYKLLGIYIGIVIALILPWYIRNMLVKSGEDTYFKQLIMKNPYNIAEGYIGFSDIILRLKNNVIDYLKILSYMLFVKVNVWIGLIILVFFIAGLFYSMEDHVVLSLSLIFYYFIIHLWPHVWTGDRFLIPIFPFIVYFFLYGISRTVNALLKSYDFIFIFVAILSVIICAPFYKKTYLSSSYIRKNIKQDKFVGFTDDWKNYFRCALWAKDHTKPSDVFIVRKPEFFYAFSGRQCILYPFTSDIDKEIDFLNKHQYAYIIVDNFYHFGGTAKYLVPALLKLKENYVVMKMYDSPPTYILRHVNYAYSSHNNGVSKGQ